MSSPTFIQSSDGYVATSLAFGSDVQVGSWVIVAVSGASSASDPYTGSPPTKSAGTATIGAFQKLKEVYYDQVGPRHESMTIFGALVTGAGSLTVDFSNVQAPNLFDIGGTLVEIGGADGTTPVIQSGVNHSDFNGGSDQPETGSFTPTAGNMVLAFWFSEQDDISGTIEDAGDGYTLIVHNTGHYHASQYKQNVPGSPVNVQFGSGGTDRWGVAWLEFQPPTGGARSAPWGYFDPELLCR